MLKEIKLLDVVYNSNLMTFYFIHKGSKVLLPVEADLESSTLHIYDALRSILKLLKIELGCIKICLFRGNVFYSHLRIGVNRKIHEVNINMLDALNIAKHLSLPIYIEEEILQECGIKVSREIINDCISRKDI